MTALRTAGTTVGRRLRVRGRTALTRRFGIDTRALAAFRISLGFLLLADWLLRSRHLVAFYTDVGVLPRTTLFDLYPGARYSLHAVSGSVWVQVVLFGLAIAFALALLLGYRTRLVTGVSFLLLTSLHARNPLVLNGGDTLLHRLLFWGVFLPLGERWSLDARGEGPPVRRVSNVATAALLVQVVIVYTVTGLYKLRGDRWIAGLELQYVFHVDQLTVLLADVLVQFPLLLKLLTWLWLGMVLSSVLLVVVTGRARVLLVSVFVVMHFGMLLTMRIGLFPVISIAALLPFLPGSVWDAVATRASATIRRLRSASGEARFRLPGRESVPDDRGPRIGVQRDRAPRFADSSGSRRLLPDDETRYRVFSMVVGGLLVSALVWNAMGLGYVATPDHLAATHDPAEHQWDMFVGGHRADGWFVAPGRLESGQRIDVLHRSTVDWDRPPDLARTYPSSRWLRYSLSLRGNGELLWRFAEHLCWRWNSQHEDDLLELTVYYIKIRVSVGGAGTPERIELLNHSCEPG